MIPRLSEKLIIQSLTTSGKIILMLGARQVGKTTLMKDIGKKMEKQGKRVLYLNCDVEEDLGAVNTTSRSVLERLVSKINVLCIDEAQRLDNPGLTLKIIHDNFPAVHVLATGSSSFDLKNKVSDPLTGRYIDFTLYPFSFVEVLGTNALLPQVLLYGFYPDIYLSNSPEQKQLFLGKITESALFKDILTFQRVKNSQAIIDLTKALAYQIGSEVNENELANRLKIDRKTVVSYVDVLEKSYVIVKVHPYSKNPRREIGRQYKVYFTDIGVRNALIGDFNPLNLRNDAGLLWENFLFMERKKLFGNAGKTVTSNFWRSYAGAEVDYIEKMTNKDMKAFEFKYGNGSLQRGAASFTKEYHTDVQLINQQNYLDFLRQE
jgi:predicted AAA+ superfamily ATPase